MAVTEVDHEPIRDMPIAATHNESGMMKELLDRMKKLETELHELRQPSSHSRDKQRPPRTYQNRRSNAVCWKCNRPGHLARECYTRLPQGNEYPRTN